MNQSKYAFQAGLFILLAIGATIAIIARIADSRGGIGNARTYIATFAPGQDISGLAVGSDVRLLGYKVGRITDIELQADGDMDAHIHVTFEVLDNVQFRRPDPFLQHFGESSILPAHEQIQFGSTEPRIEAQTSFTGGAWLNILSLGEGLDLPDQALIPARSVNLNAMVDEVRAELTTTLASVRKEIASVGDEITQTTTAFEQTADAFEDTAHEATALIEKIESEIDPALEQYTGFMAEATGVMQEVNAVFGDSGEDIRTTLANFNTITTTFDARLPGMLDGVDSALASINTLVEDVGGFVDRAEQSVDSVDALLADAGGLTRELRATLGDNRVEIDRMVTNARRTIAELRGLMEDLRANPSRLVWPPDDRDLANLELYAVARQYANAAEDLQSAVQQLRDATVTDPSDDPANAERLEQMREHLMEQFEYFDDLQRELWERYER
ncbi:MAG: MlaD family protein [Phycisphaerales bacterium JB063]